MSRPPASPFRRIDRGRNHSYQDAGREVDGVTSLIAEGYPRPALVGWAAREVAELAADKMGVIANMRHDEIVDFLRGAPWRERDAAANRGTEVHRLAEQLAAGEEVSVPEELTGHVDSYLRWRDQYEPTEELIERPVLNRTWRYAGTLDNLCRIHGELCLIDYKTNRSGVFAEVALQLCAYGRAEVYLDQDGTERPMPEIDRYLVLWLRSDGFDLYPVEVTEREWKTFLWVSEIGRWIRERGDRDAPERVVGPALYQEQAS